MPRKLERAALLLLFLAAPLWLPAVQPQGAALRMTFTGWMEPGLRIVHAAQKGVHQLFTGLFRGVRLAEENRRFKQDLAALLAHEETHRQLFEQNARFRELLEFKAQAPWTLIPAEIIGRELGPWSRTLLLDKGARAGIRSGMAVMTPVGLVGRVSEVGSTTSRVRLINDFHFRVPGTVSKTQVAGLVKGGSPGECVLTYLPPGSEVPPGTLVVTTGGKSFSPKGIPVGTVKKIEPDPSQLYWTATLQPAVNVNALEEVLVVVEAGE